MGVRGVEEVIEVTVREVKMKKVIFKEQVKAQWWQRGNTTDP